MSYEAARAPCPASLRLSLKDTIRTHRTHRMRLPVLKRRSCLEPMPLSDPLARLSQHQFNTDHACTPLVPALCHCTPHTGAQTDSTVVATTYCRAANGACSALLHRCALHRPRAPYSAPYSARPSCLQTKSTVIHRGGPSEERASAELYAVRRRICDRAGRAICDVGRSRCGEGGAGTTPMEAKSDISCWRRVLNCCP